MTKREKSLREKLGYAPSADGIDCSQDPQIVEEHHAIELDINRIVKRYSPQDLADWAYNVQEAYADFTEMEDFHDIMNKVASANQAFEQMPAQVRARFQNDPGRLLEFLNDDRNRPEAEMLGLVKKREQTSPPEAKKEEPKTH